MKETADDLVSLAALLAQSIDAAGQFLREAFQMPDHSLSAAQLVKFLDGIKTVALATVTAKGEPRVAPVGSIFYRAQFYIPTVMNAARARHVAERPAISLTYANDVELAIVVHGKGHLLRPADADFAELETIQKEIQGRSVRDWGDGVYIRVDASVIYTFARHPERI